MEISMHKLEGKIELLISSISDLTAKNSRTEQKFDEEYRKLKAANDELKTSLEATRNENETLKETVKSLEAKVLNNKTETNSKIEEIRESMNHFEQEAAMFPILSENDRKNMIEKSLF